MNAKIDSLSVKVDKLDRILRKPGELGPEKVKEYTKVRDFCRSELKDLRAQQQRDSELQVEAVATVPKRKKAKKKAEQPAIPDNMQTIYQWVLADPKRLVADVQEQSPAPAQTPSPQGQAAPELAAPAAAKAQCRGCKDTGLDAFGKPCSCSRGRQAKQLAAAQAAQDEAEARMAKVESAEAAAAAAAAAKVARDEVKEARASPAMATNVVPVAKAPEADEEEVDVETEELEEEPEEVSIKAKPKLDGPGDVIHCAWGSFVAVASGAQGVSAQCAPAQVASDAPLPAGGGGAAPGGGDAAAAAAAAGVAIEGQKPSELLTNVHKRRAVEAFGKANAKNKARPPPCPATPLVTPAEWLAFAQRKSQLAAGSGWPTQC